MTAATHIVERTLALIPGSPAQVLLDVSGKVIEPLVREGLSLALSVVAFVLMLTAREGLRPEDWCPDEAFDDEICQDLIARARGHDGDPGPNVLALASWLLGVVPGLLPAHSARAAADAFARLGSQEREVERGLSDASYALSGNRRPRPGRPRRRASRGSAVLIARHPDLALLRVRAGVGAARCA